MDGAENSSPHTYTAQALSGSEPMRARIPGFPRGPLTTSVSGAPSAAGLMKPFKFKTHEEAFSRPFRLSSSVNPSTPVKTSFLKSGMSLGPLKPTANHNHAQIGTPGRVAFDARGGGLQNVEDSPLHENRRGLLRHSEPSATKRFSLEPSISPPAEQSGAHSQSDPTNEEDEFQIQYIVANLRGVKKENISLRAQNEDLARSRNQQQQEIQRLESQLTQASSELAAYRQSHNGTRIELAASSAQVEDLTIKLEVAEASTKSLNEEIERLVDENMRMKERESTVEAKVEAARQSLAAVRQQNDEVFKDVEESKKALSALKAREAEYLQEVRLLRNSAKEAVNTVESMSSSVWVTKAREARELTADLQSELHSSHRVTDILRDQLLHSTSQLVESQQRVKELEASHAETIGTLERRLQGVDENLGVVLQLDQKYADVQARLDARERGTVDALAIAAKIEEELVMIKNENHRLTGISKEQGEELAALRSAKEQHLTKVLEMQQAVNSRDSEISGLRAEIKAVHESKADVRALLTDAKKTIIEKEQYLAQSQTLNAALDSKVAEAHELVAQVRESEGIKLQGIQGALATCQKKCTEQEAEIQVLDARLKEKQSQLDEFRTLLQAKELSLEKLQKERKEDQQRLESAAVDVKEKMVSVARLEKDVERLETEKLTLLTAAREKLELIKSVLATTESEKAQEKARAEKAIATAQEKSMQLTELQSSVSRSQKEQEGERQRHQSILNSITQKHVKETEVQEKLQEAQYARAVASDATRAMLQKELDTERETVMGLERQVMLFKSKVEQLELQVQSSKEGRGDMYSLAEVEALRTQLETLKAKNAELDRRSNTLMERYKLGDLASHEKELVNYVVGLTERSNEQVLIEKDHEIKSRGNQIVTLQQRIKVLQKHLAQTLPQAPTQGTRLVNIHSLAASSSSPPSAQKIAQAPAAEPTRPALETPAKAAASFSRASAPMPVEDVQPSLKKLAQQSDDDDIITDPFEPSVISEFSPDPKKRNRPPTPVQMETRTVKKRMKTKEAAKGEAGKAFMSEVTTKKPMETVPPKGRQRKRRS